MTAPTHDDLARRLRDAYTTGAVPPMRNGLDPIDVDGAYAVQAINTRLKLVARLRAYKQQQGIGFVDPSREEWMHRFLQGTNAGPLSREGLRELYDHLLELTKRETARDD